MATRGSGTKYARKYVKATQEEMRKTIIPQAADYCAQKRVIQDLSPEGYRACLRDAIHRLIKGETLPSL